MENCKEQLRGQDFSSVQYKEPVIAAQCGKNDLFTVYKLRQVQEMIGSTRQEKSDMRDSPITGKVQQPESCCVLHRRSACLNNRLITGQTVRQRAVTPGVDPATRGVRRAAVSAGNR